MVRARVLGRHPVPAGLNNYKLEVEWLITWFSHRANANTQQTRAGVAYFDTDTLAGMPSAQLLLGHPGEDPLHPDNLAKGWITLSVDENTTFIVVIEAWLGNSGELGPARRIKTIYARPGLQLPFMVNVVGIDQEVMGTSLSLYGTITTGNRPFDRLLEDLRVLRR
jgi:hypothetical protein